MDILQYINKMNRLYGNDPTPVRYNTQQYLQGGRVGMKPGGLVEPGVTHYATNPKMARPGNVAYKFRKDPPSIVNLKKLLDKLKPGDSFNISDLAKKSGATRKTVSEYLRRDYPQLGIGEGTKIQRKELGKRTIEAGEAEYKKLLERGYLEEYKKKITSARGAADESLFNKALAKKYFPNLSEAAAIGRIERANARIRKEFPDLTYKKVEPQEFVKKRKRRLDIVQGGKYIGGTEKNPFHHIMPIGGETPITTKDVTIISKQMNSKLAPYNKKLNDIADAISDHYTNRSPGFQKRIDELHKNAEQIINKVKKELPKKYQGLVGFTKLEPIYDEYGTIFRLQANRIGIDEKKSIAGVKGEAEEIGKMTDKRLTEFRKQTSNKKIAKILSDSGIKCKLQEGLTCNDPRAYMKALEETKAKAALGDKAALGKFRKVANAMRKLKGAAAFTGWGILGEIGFALPFAAMDYADGQSTARIINNASFGLFGMNEEEETISYLPEGSKGAEQIALEKSYMRHSALTDPDKRFPKGRIGMDPKRFQTAQQDVIKGAHLDLIKKVTPFMQGPRNEYFNQEAFAKAHGEVEAAKAKQAVDIAKRKEERTVDTVFDYYDNYLPGIDDDK